MLFYSPGFVDSSSFMLSRNRRVLAWPLIKSDPGLLFFLLSRNIDLSNALLTDEDRQAASAMLSDAAAPGPTGAPESLRPAIRTAVAAAHFAELLAKSLDNDPAKAWAGAGCFSGWWPWALSTARAVSIVCAPSCRSIRSAAPATRLGHEPGRYAWRLASSGRCPSGLAF